MVATLPDRLFRSQHPEEGKGYLLWKFPNIALLLSIGKKVGGSHTLTKSSTSKGNKIIMTDLEW